MNLFKFTKDIKRNIQRWNFKRKYKNGIKVDLDKLTQAIEKAELLSKKRKCRLWVIRVMPGHYAIKAKGDVKAAFRAYKIMDQVNMFELGDVVVHITK
jgi:hypothetical protein